MNDIILKEKERSLHISRIPKNTKEFFIQIAEEEFAGDYGLLLKWCFEQALEYQRAKDVLFDKEFLMNILEIKSQKEQEEQPEKTDSKRMMSGRIVKGGKNE